jgi:S-adenosylmethionine:tRNA ribosyltransferase-isomerase
MNVDLFDYNLPKRLISQKLILPRDKCKFLVYDRKSKLIKHHIFSDIVNYLDENDVLILNDTKVFPSRLIGEKETGGKVEIFLLNPINNDFSLDVKEKWYILVNKKVEHNSKIIFKKDKKIILSGIIKKDIDTIEIKFDRKGKKLWKSIYLIGNMPIPPYIKSQKDQKHYQTVYAKNLGSCAAPTAGFHFTDNLLKKLKTKGVKIEFITLNVGLGTFKPIKVDNVEDHRMDTEFLSIDKKVAERLTKYKKEGKKMVAVGTTVVRTLESIYDGKRFKDNIRKTNIFIYPGYTFKVIDKFVTNFHFPRSTPLMMVSAFVMDKQKDFDLSRNEVLRIYNAAIKKRYMFYSFGESMMII